MPLASDLQVYYLVAGAFIILALGASALLRSRLGRYWVAIRDAPVAAAAMGVAVSRQKVVAFAVSSGIAGFGGALLGTVVTHVGPFDFGLLWSITLILAVIVGGSGSIPGTVFGAAFVVLVPVALSRTAGLADAIFGISLVIVFIIAPGGLPAITSRVTEWLVARQAGRRGATWGSTTDAVD